MPGKAALLLRAKNPCCNSEKEGNASLSESGNGRTRVLHRNLLLPCSFLPVETHLKSPKRRHTVSRRTHRQQTSKEETTGTIDEDIPSLTPDQLQEFYESTRHDTEDSCGPVPELVEQDTYTCPVDGQDSEGEVHTRLCPLVWSELFRTIALLLGVVRDFIVGLFKTEFGKRRV